MVKGFLVSLGLACSVFTANALEFAGIELDNLNKTQLNKALLERGAKLKTSSSLTDVYKINSKSIPDARYIRTFYNHEKEFVGLEVLFPYKPDYYINMRKALAEKYGLPFVRSRKSDDFLGQYISRAKYTWSFKNNKSLVFDEASYDSKKLTDRSMDYSLFYRDDKKRGELINKLTEQSYKNNKGTLKSAF